MKNLTDLKQEMESAIKNLPTKNRSYEMASLVNSIKHLKKNS